jgi:hypothetical protein
MQGGDRDFTKCQPWCADGKWLRCALHAHTTQSDGELAPDLLALHYERAGYDVLAVTDHWKRTEATAERILVIPSVELNCILPGARDGHVLGFGVDCDPGDLEALAEEYCDLPRTADWIGQHGGIAYLAHPYWTGVTPGTLELPPNVAGIEVYNAGCELEVGRGLSVVHWDELAEAGRLCPAIASDDSHHPGFDSDLAWTWVRAKERTAAEVLGALAGGVFYSTSGPLLKDVARDRDAVEVSCSPCRSVTLVSGKSIGSAVNAGRLGYVYRGRVLATDEAGGLVVRARLEIPPAARHVRVEITDAAGRKAWANPFPV